jgi:pyrimidine operon attenuation protein/uracil phosphoribosyltransferase
MERTLVLDQAQIEAKINRIAWQIAEQHLQEKEIILAGIDRRGYILAKALADKIEEIGLQVMVARMRIHKDKPWSVPVEADLPSEFFKGKSVVVVDDVLNSGATLIYGVKFFLDHPVKRITTAVLVDRNHKRYPVKADFKGISLSTTLLERVEAHIEQEPFAVYLSVDPGKA